MISAQSSPPRFLGRVGTLEAWTLGNATLIIPTIPDDASPRLKAALARRRLSMFTGRCECGAVVELRRGRADHVPGCDAVDSVVKRLLRAEGFTA